MGMLKCVLLSLCVVAVLGRGPRWSQPGGQLEDVSVGRAGVWGVNKEDQIYYREGTSSNPTNHGTDWTKVEGYLQRVEVGLNTVFGIQADGKVVYRTDISPKRPMGAEWHKMDGRLVRISVSPNGNLWGINEDREVYYRTGSSNLNPVGDDWERVADEYTKKDGKKDAKKGGRKDGDSDDEKAEGQTLKLVQLSAGYAGVWAVSKDQKAFYRQDTFGDLPLNSSGSIWVQVEGLQLKHVTSGDGFVLGITAEGLVFIREGISHVTPTGETWSEMGNGKFQALDTYGDKAWGVSKRGEILLADIGQEA